jgi:hypothetical protein
VSAHQIGKNLVLHWNSEDGGKKSFMEHIQFTQGKMKKEKKKRLLLCIAFFLLPPSPHQEKNFFPQYFCLIKERPKTYSHQKIQVECQCLIREWWPRPGQRGKRRIEKKQSDDHGYCRKFLDPLV